MISLITPMLHNTSDHCMVVGSLSFSLELSDKKRYQKIKTDNRYFYDLYDSSRRLGSIQLMVLSYSSSQRFRILSDIIQGHSTADQYVKLWENQFWFVSWARFLDVNKDVSKISLTVLKLKLNQEEEVIRIWVSYCFASCA